MESYQKSNARVRRNLELRALKLGNAGMGDLLGGKKRVLVLVDHQFGVIFLCNFEKNLIN